MARVVKAHGVRGDVLVDLVTDRAERLAVGSQLHTDTHGALRVESSRRHQTMWIVRFDRVVTREAAEALRGARLRAEPLDDPDELWVHELIGSPVVRGDDEPCGTVEAVQANPAADLLVLDTGALVPATFVVGRRADGVVVIDPPEGLLELYTQPE